MNENQPSPRVLGDEWFDWDGSIDRTLEHTKQKLFLWFSVFAVFTIIMAVFIFAWLIHPRLMEISAFLAIGVQYAVFGFAGVLVLWLGMFIFSVAFNLELFAPLLLVPKAINLILNLTLNLGQFLGISRDRMINSFLKVHNLVLRLRRSRLRPQELLVLLPRCLRKESFELLARLREKYHFHMYTVGGGQQARSRIRKMMPRAIIAIACERDLLSGFVEVNPKIPVIGLPNSRPEGPCKNTEIDIGQVEAAVRHLLNCDPREKLSYRT